MAQLAPGIILGLFWPRVTRPAVIGGAVTGLGIMAGLGLTHRVPFHGCSAGFLALCTNLVLTVAATLLGRAPAPIVAARERLAP